ncbi:unnamed protein product [Closterium sp. Yama58-4]|nr:unnamed protein product [Closterium sp. Yama58-4]
MGGATGGDGIKGETAHEVGRNAGSGATAHGAGENAGSGATAHKAGEERGEGAKAHETGEERGEGATVHGVMREGMAVLIDVNGEKASFAMLQRNRCDLRHAAAQQVYLAVSLPLIRRLHCPTTLHILPSSLRPPSPFLRSFLRVFLIPSAPPPCTPTVRVGKQQCSLAPLVGCPFGSVFELRMGGEEGAGGDGGEGGGGEGENGEGGQAKDGGGEGEDDKGDGGKGGKGKWGGRGGGRGGGGRGEEGEGGEEEGGHSCEGVKDNRNLIDDNTAQKLSANEIAALKRQAASGHEVVRALAANSVSFHTKTDFAQEKYLRKKQKKHAPRLVARFPTADRSRCLPTMPLCLPTMPRCLPPCLAAAYPCHVPP